MGGLHKEVISLFSKKETKVSTDIEDMNSRHSGGLQILRSGGGGGNDSKKVVIVNEKSILFLLKKFFVCGFSSVPGRVRDPSSQPTLGQIWTSILHKKIYPQWSSREPSSIPKKKYIENGSALEIDWLPEASGSKWDRTDSEYIVLEI